jgi:acetate kinase
MPSHVLTINSGSSSIKFVLFAVDGQTRRLAGGQVERIGLAGPRFVARFADGRNAIDSAIEAVNHQQAIGAIVRWLDQSDAVTSLTAIGHRIVHGGDQYVDSVQIDDAVIGTLRGLVPLAPNHLPGEIAAVEAVRRHCPNLPQYGCFDTAFHRDLPDVARTLPLPRRYAAKGLRRYGFHGLSYSYLIRELGCVAGDETAQGRVILAHLGAGCSLAAVHDGRCIDTTMGFTPTAGLVMATRTGDLDPGALIHLQRTDQLSADALESLVNRESGLLGLSESSSDVRDLLARESEDYRAKEALDVFCYQIRKWIGAYAAALEGLDTIVFSAGIGENSPVIRSRICSGLRHLGVHLDEWRNSRNEVRISDEGAAVAVYVIRTDEELMMVNEVTRLAGLSGSH